MIWNVGRSIEFNGREIIAERLELAPKTAIEIWSGEMPPSCVRWKWVRWLAPGTLWSLTPPIETAIEVGAFGIGKDQYVGNRLIGCNRDPNRIGLGEVGSGVNDVELPGNYLR